MVEAYPLSWPVGVKRNTTSTKARFKKNRSIKQAFTQLAKELRKLGALGVVISSNLELKNNGEPYSTSVDPADPGIAVYFTLKGKQYCMPCDRWNSAADNLWALACHISAMRGQSRWGVATVEQAFAGFKALTANASTPDCWQVLGVVQGASKLEINAAYRTLARELHPDVEHGDLAAMTALNIARDQALAQG